MSTVGYLLTVWKLLCFEVKPRSECKTSEALMVKCFEVYESKY